MKFYFTVVAIAFIAFAGTSFIMFNNQPHATQAPAKKANLTIAQQVAADKAEARSKVEIESAIIEGAFNHALNDVGSQTQLHYALEMAKWNCFGIKGQRGGGSPGTQESIDCAHREAEHHPGIELMVFARMP